MQERRERESERERETERGERGERRGRRRKDALPLQGDLVAFESVPNHKCHAYPSVRDMFRVSCARGGIQRLTCGGPPAGKYLEPLDRRPAQARQATTCTREGTADPHRLPEGTRHGRRHGRSKDGARQVHFPRLLGRGAPACRYDDHKYGSKRHDWKPDLTHIGHMATQTTAIIIIIIIIIIISITRKTTTTIDEDHDHDEIE